MKRPLRGWWSLVVASALVALAATAAAEEQARDRGLALGEEFVREFGSADQLRARLGLPLTSDAAKLTTLDASSAFSAQLSLPSSRRFLEIFVQPGATGDLVQVIVAQDLDFDGHLDYSHQTPFLVSGVCANGVISCAPGTWEQCRSYRWALEDGRLAFHGADLAELGGCFCLNNACGNQLAWRNLGAVLHALGGGAVGVLQQAQPQYRVSRVEAGEASIAYFGQDSRPDPGAPEVPAATLSRYRQNPLALAEALAVEVERQESLPESPFSHLSQLAQAAATSGEARVCRIDRLIEVRPRSDYCENPLPEGALEPWTQTQSWFKVFSHSFRNRNDCRCQNVPGAGCPPVAAAMRVNQAPEGAVDQGLFSENFRDRKKKDGKDDCTGDAYRYYRLCHRHFDVYTHAINDGCAGLEANSHCALREEVVDGVTTYRQFNPTGLSPLPSARWFAGVHPHEFTYPWWRKDRSYVCRDGEAFDFSALKTRMGRVVGSVREQDGSLDYEDLRQVGGGWLTEAASLQVPPAPDFAECEPLCKTRRLADQAQVSHAGQAADLKTGIATYEFFYHPCRDGRCPATATEEILQDCQCLDEFAEAATILQALRLAGRDQVCSDGAAKSLP